MIDFAQKTLKTAPEFLWAKFPMYAVLRRPDHRKWYAVIMRVDREKLRLPGDGSVEIVVLKLNPPLIDALLARPGFLPAYHMNKANWITVLLDETVPTADIFELLRYRCDRAFLCFVANTGIPYRKGGLRENQEKIYSFTG